MRYLNPFIVTGKIVDKYFCDRREESEKIVNKIKNGNNMVIISPRRMGKTGLISYCLDRPEMNKDYITVFIDILQTSSLAEFAYVLGRAVFENLMSRKRRSLLAFVSVMKSLQAHFGFDPMTGNPTFNVELGDISRPEITLDEIFRYLDGAEKRCVVAIDEFQQIAKYPEKNIEALLRSHIQKCDNCNFIFAGSERHMMQRIFLAENHPFYHSAEVMELFPIPYEIYVEFVKNNFNEFDRRISSDLIAKVYNLFEGHTFYMQKTFNEVFAATMEGAECGVDDINAAIDNMISSQDTIFREILSNVPLKQKELLYAVAINGKVESITSAAFIKNNGLQSASSVQSAARILTDKGLLTMNDKVYSITDRLFGMWIKRNYGSLQLLR